MRESTPYIAYYVAQQQKGVKRSFSLNRKQSLHSISEVQKQIFEDFLASKVKELDIPEPNIIETFCDTFDSQRTAKWPELLNAIKACQANNAILLIIELGTLARNESFSTPLINAGIQFYCCDQTFVNQAILIALNKSAQIEKQIHGKRIKEGLKNTSLKSGNPNAAKVIGEVNKPKIHTAIVFAFVLQLILNDYIANGYSQRDMVKTLNDEGFTAPEGGTWVLSQFQKVLERARLNKVATNLELSVNDLMKQGLTPAEIATDFNAKGITPLKRSTWDEQQVKKLQERIQQIQDIMLLNHFVLALLPLLHDYQAQDVSLSNMLAEFHDAGIPIRSSVNLNLHTETRKTVLIPPNRRVLLEQVKRNVMAFPADTASLQTTLESTLKHLPAYLTIVKSHLDQLATVLELANHGHQDLSKAALAKPVSQLMNIFKELREEDFQTLENLFYATANWQTEITKPTEELQTALEA